ncbi:MAG TPA: TlyA family RNA methyltransferase [Candidatus Saccharimonadales bacterium]|nr:TlyA family RNA methyltransferase [Candidatus Saccharimonadales bacterium]
MIRLDQVMVKRGLATSRSQAENYIKLGLVTVDGWPVLKAGQLVGPEAKVNLSLKQQYVNRAALKLAGAAESLKLDFKDKLVLDVGSSTGGFTDYALTRGARRVIAVDAGTDQLDARLRANEKVELYEKTDIRQFKMSSQPDTILVDVSFISLKNVLPSIAGLAGPHTQVVALVKPQFEAGAQKINKGVIKNDSIRRAVMKDFEAWAKNMFVVIDKADSEIAGAKGNKERFYLLKKVPGRR